ncbi:MAG: prepilin-type N-terminal cleavage/methylation domain-containing protein [Ilumatobacter sp.]|uniref:prepilin-type N-terminal cleavage/methylation domain-containing protein n=1 Tax=Ilumatobacter sp. TaxID=1967498 RepID=UPI0026384C26|nr:prepilin-type N-terminal cleavage/methylation domain-containing protein [Ilumatobacter sp.]MDJ0770040.1 prepilin-type N-terminal cleavage/methylation domain-containing protein [Ilumatobacter sp.]
MNRGVPQREGTDRGFTLIELLVVIVILGVLAMVVVFAVRGVNNQAEASACGAELRILSTAVEAYNAETNTIADEAALVSAGVIRTASSLYDVSVDGNGGYDIGPAAGSGCTGSVSSSGPPAPPAPPPVPPAVPTAISYGTIPAWEYGVAGEPNEIVVLGGAEGAADFIQMITAAPPTARRVTFINLSQINADTDIDYILDTRARQTGTTDLILYPDDDTSTITRSSGGTWASVDDYLISVDPGDGWLVWQNPPRGDGFHYADASGPTLESLILAIG